MAAKTWTPEIEATIQQNSKSRDKDPRSLRRRLLVGSSVFALAASGGLVVSHKQASAADLSANLEAGGTVTIDDADTFTIDNTNDGESAALASTTVVDFATSGSSAATDSLTISSDGSDAQDTADTGAFLSITVTDDNGTNTLTLNDATSGDLTLVVTGGITSNTSDTNDLEIVINATENDATGGGDSTLILNGAAIDLGGGGGITLNSDSDDTATLQFNRQSAQTLVGDIKAAADGEGVLDVNNALTTNDDIGVAGTGIGSIQIASGVTLAQTGLAAGDALTFDVVGNIDADGAGGTGGTLPITGGAASGTPAGAAIT